MGTGVRPERQARLREPYDPPPDARLRVLPLLLALVAATAAALAAPDPWPDGAGEIAVRYRGELVAAAPVTVGATDAVTVRGAGGVVALPGGLPTDAVVEVEVAITAGGATVRPGLDEVRVELTLPDGRRELIPALRWEHGTALLMAARRPPVDAAVVLGLLGLVVVLWVSEAVPLFVTSLAIPVVLVVAGVGDAQEALAPFFHPIIALFFGGFLMAEAMRRVDLDHLAAVTIIARAGHSPVTLFAAMLGVAAFLSMWMSNTAATAVLVPIAIAVTAPLGHPGYRKAVVLGIAYAATIGGVGSAIGTPANPLAIEFLGAYAGRSVTFAGWFAIGLPMVVLFLPLMGVYLWRRSAVQVDPARFAATRRLAAEELERHGPPTRDQATVLAVFAGVVAVWLTQTWHGLDTGIVAVGGAVALAALGKVLPDDLGRISWASLLTFGGGLALGLSLVQTGTSDWVATRLDGLSGVPPLVGTATVALLALALTTVASNTATAAMLIPLAIPLAGVIGVDPVLLVLVVAIASSVDFALVIGTPPTMIAYSTHLYTSREIFRTGIALDVAGVALLVTAVVGIWNALGIL